MPDPKPITPFFSTDPRVVPQPSDQQEQQEPKLCECGGTGEIFTHAEDCDNDLCALNGDIHSCAGQVIPCGCRKVQP